METEDQSCKLDFFTVTIVNIGAGKYEFKIHWKNAITNVQIICIVIKAIGTVFLWKII